MYTQTTWKYTRRRLTNFSKEQYAVGDFRNYSQRYLAV